MLGSLLVWLNGCAIGTPWPRLPAASPEQAEEQVVLVLTHVAVDTKQRREFDRQNSRVLASMGSHPGLIGYAARRQLFGDQGWTMSVWANDQARAAFVRSAVHREAIARSMPALRTVELKRVTVARKDLPADWDQVLRMLAEPEGRRNYWE
jgi:heme-degrading monooxygenase HmoA